MPPKKRQRYGKSSKAKKNEETRKNLSPVVLNISELSFPPFS
jgi:hypothetical protein